MVSSEDVDDEFRQSHGNGEYSGGNREGAENMSSTVTDNTDSVTYQWSNRVCSLHVNWVCIVLVYVHCELYVM